MHEDDSIFGSAVLPMHEDDPIFGIAAHGSDSVIEAADSEALDICNVVDDCNMDDAFAETFVQDSPCNEDTFLDTFQDTVLLDGFNADGKEMVGERSAAISGIGLAINDKNLDTVVEDESCPLLAAWKAPVSDCQEEPSSSECWDSQLSANENPNESSQPAVLPANVHFTQRDEFWKSVRDRLDEHEWKPTLWPSLKCLTPDFLTNADICSGSIQGLISGATAFIIGIAADPHWRFFECADGDYAKRFSHMVIIYASEFSHKDIMDSTGMMEVAMITRFKYLDACLNKKPGGERPSKPKPHFMYIVY